MEDQKFIDELIEGMLKNEKWKLKEEHIVYYVDRYTAPEGDKESLAMIRDTNIRYHKVESDTLIGNYIVIKKKEDDQLQNICRFDADQLYKDFQQKGWDSVWETIQAHLNAIDVFRDSDVFSVLDNYEAMKKHLIIRPINFTDNRFTLKNHVYRQVGDIALVLYMVICESKEMGLNTAKVPKPSYDKWSSSSGKIWEDALMNTYVLAPPRMYMNPMDTVHPPYTKGAFMAIGGKPDKIYPLQVPTLTTTKQTNGAIAMFYPGVMEKISEMAGGNFYAAFTSIHDVRIHCEKSIPPRHILQNLKSVNDHFDPAEILSRKVFFYNAKSKEFSVVEF